MPSRLATLSLSLTLAACGPQPADPATTDDPTGDATTTSSLSTGSTGDPTTGDPTSTTDATTGSTSSDPETSTTSTTGSPDTTGTSSTGGTTGDHEIWPCDSANKCDENEHCTPEARVNADIAGDTPLGPFKGTFAFASAAIAFGDLGIVYVVPEYATDICAAAPTLLVELGQGHDKEFVVEAPIALDDGQGQIAQTTATVHVANCCNFLWFCECENPSPYEIEITVAGDGWSLAGTARPNCCRSFSIDEAA